MSGTDETSSPDKRAVGVDRRRRHEERERAAGWTRCIVRCHVDDVEKVKTFAAALIEERREPKDR